MISLAESKPSTSLFSRRAPVLKIGGRPIPLTLVLIAIIVIILIFGTLIFLLTILHRPTTHIVVIQGPPKISAGILSQNLTYYNSGTVFIPYILLNYYAANISMLNINATFYKQPLPQTIYILSHQNNCYNCGNVSAVISTMENILSKYNLQYDIRNISIQNILTIKRNSILIILNGYMPRSMFNVSNNSSVLEKLLSKGTSIIYIGQNFSTVLISTTSTAQGSNKIKNLTEFSWLFGSQIPQIQKTGYNPYNFSYKNVTFYFDNQSFQPRYGEGPEGLHYGSVTYKNILNGSIIAFSNFLTTWKNPTAAGEDIAKVIAQQFWLKKYTSGNMEITINSNPSSRKVGILLNTTLINITNVKQQVSMLNSGYIRVALSDSSNYNLTNSSIYQYLYPNPSYSISGNLSMPANIIPSIQEYVTWQLFINSANSHELPLLHIYNVNTGAYKSEINLNLTFGNTSTQEPIRFENYPPGNYMALLLNSTLNSTCNCLKQYAAAYFQVPPINLTFINQSSNRSENVYVFHLSMSNTNLSQINYTVKLNGGYPKNGTTSSNGIVVFDSEKGIPERRGILNFTFYLLNTQVSNSVDNRSGWGPINMQYIEIGVVAAVAALLVIFVRTPQIDEFYIDVPSMPRKTTTEIKLTPSTIIGSFDKLNNYYHWHYMPLSPTEVKVGIANNVRYQGMPVNLTFSNIEFILDQLVGRKELVSIESLYAPREWIDASGHDIEYLATFKKLRLYLVTHALVFTDIDSSPSADMVVTLHGERIYIVIYSETTKFKNVPIYKDSMTYMTFLNDDKLEAFKAELYKSSSPDAEILKTYISAGIVKLLDADNPETLFG